MMNGLILIETQKTILELLMKNLQAIALQTGSEVSYHEIGQLAGADSQQWNAISRSSNRLL